MGYVNYLQSKPRRCVMQTEPPGATGDGCSRYKKPLASGLQSLGITVETWPQPLCSPAGDRHRGHHRLPAAGAARDLLAQVTGRGS